MASRMDCFDPDTHWTRWALDPVWIR